MKKIIIVTRSMFAGGAERVIAQLANYFATNDIECTIITIDNENVLYDLNQNINLIPIGKKSGNKLNDKFLRYSELRKIVVSENPDTVLSMPEDIGIYVILTLLGTHIPVFVSERNNPWVMPDVKVTRILRKLMYPFAKGIIFQTEMAKSFFSNSIQCKGVVLSNPVELDRILEPFEGEREKVIVGAGRLDKQKNFPLLIGAFAKFSKEHSDYKLRIFGEGRLREELMTLIDKNGLSGKVELPGRKNDLLEQMNSASMFVLSSDYEGMPNVLIEAMCMGMPVISTDCPSGGPRELIENNVNGILVPVSDIDALHAAMNKMTDYSFASTTASNAYRIKDKLTDPFIFERWKEYIFNS